MSGAGSIKWDGSDDDTLYEVKDANKSYTLTGKLLRDLFTEAARQERSPQLIVTFKDAGVVATISVTLSEQE